MPLWPTFNVPRRINGGDSATQDEAVAILEVRRHCRPTQGDCIGIDLLGLQRSSGLNIIGRSCWLDGRAIHRPGRRRDGRLVLDKRWVAGAGLCPIRLNLCWQVGGIDLDAITINGDRVVACFGCKRPGCIPCLVSRGIMPDASKPLPAATLI